MDAQVHDRIQETLVVAARTEEHPGLVAALRREAHERATAFTLLVPALPACDGADAVDLAAGWSAALSRAERAARRLREAGLELREAIVGDADCGSQINLQRITNTSLAFRSPRLGAFLRSRRGAGVILDSRKTAPRWRDDARARTTARSAPARAAAAPRSSS